MNVLNTERRRQIIAALVVGNSIRATCRMTGAAKGTVTKLLVEIGQACDEYQDRVLRDFPCKRIQCDEIWAFCHAKEKNVPDEHKGEFGYGDVWTWVGIDADTKLAVSWMVGRRDLECAQAFIADLANRLSNRVQLTTDGHKAYLQAVDEAFGGEIDYGVLCKLYGDSTEEGRYSPGKVIGTEKHIITGSPDKKHISTSYVERQNLTIRMSMRRFTRLTNAFSRKVENLESAIALHFMYYNFCRIHQTLRVTPAMEAGVTDHLWDLEEVIALLD